jgi:L-ascorbate metabolism protein UlaG (beta-lactamase superfamily)
MRSVLTALAFVLGAAAFAAAPDRFPAAGGEIVITPLLHSSVQIEHAGRVVQVDPWSLADLSTAKAADLILVTDDPGHHLDLKAIERLRKPGAPIVMPATGKAKIPDGHVLPNGDTLSFGTIRVDAIAAYDITPGEPYHPKGEANGYILTLGGKRIYLAGVTECVPEIRALRNVDITFFPINLPLDRMTPARAAECLKSFKPKVAYFYHYDQDYVTRITKGAPQTGGSRLNLAELKDGLTGETIELRDADWYPAR